MKIKSIHIKNVRGFQDEQIELNMVPNKPSLLVAPNGSGKSSFAIAFQSLQKNKLSVPENEIYNYDLSRKPELEIIMEDGSSFISNENNHQIQSFFSVYVINNKNKPKASIRNISGTRVASVKMCVEPIVLINKIPGDVKIDYSLEMFYALDNLSKGTIPSIKELLKNYKYLSDFNVDDLLHIKKALKTIDEFLERLKVYSGTKKEVWAKIESDDLHELERIGILASRVQHLKNIYPTDNNAQLYLRAIQIVKTYADNPQNFKKKIEYAKYQTDYNLFNALFASLKETWRGIKPKIQGDKLIVEIPDSSALSNGERDIIVFLAMLERAKTALVKENNILIIDEIFDYLDDANFISAYYYILELIFKMQKENKNIYPIIMSHLNPEFFDYFPRNQALCVYYLKPQSIHPTSDNIMKVLRKRENNLGKDDDWISKYMLHFYKSYDASVDKLLGDAVKSWGGVQNFKRNCQRQMDLYLENKDPYEPIFVCIWLRECIEKYVYERLSEESKKEFFDGNQAKGTRSKLMYAEKCGISFPTSFLLLGPIYNDPLHPNNGFGKKDLRQTLYSRLQNNTIRGMIEKIVKNTIEF